MKKGQFGEAQIIGVLQEHEKGAAVADLCRKHGMSEMTFYCWKRKYGGMEVSEASRIKELEVENDRLKRVVAELEVDRQILREALRKK